MNHYHKSSVPGRSAGDLIAGFLLGMVIATAAVGITYILIIGYAAISTGFGGG